MSIQKYESQVTSQASAQARKDHLWNVQDPGDPYDIKKFYQTYVGL